MTGRDPGEHHRASTPLELLFDLTFVVGFGTAADEFAHYLSLGEVRTSLIGFCFSVFAISWAWINFSWFASAYDTDDWVFRLLTLVQMVGVLVLSLGIASLFESIARHEPVANGVIVAGYVVMRVAMVAQWGRAAHQDPSRRSASRVYMITILVAQAGWVGLVFAHVHIGEMLALAVPLIAIELLGPLIAETRYDGTPWHPHHIAERYGLLVIICLGEAILGTVAALGAVVGPSGDGWSVKAAVIGLAGVTLTFGMWWIYFVVPSAEILARRQPLVRVGLRSHTDLRSGRGHGRWPPCRGLLRRASHEAVGVRHAADDRDPGGHLRARALRAVRVPDRVDRSVSLRADRAVHAGAGDAGGDGRNRGGPRVVPAGAVAGSMDHRRRV
jgi:low temperature requirement protein LtrA